MAGNEIGPAVDSTGASLSAVTASEAVVDCLLNGSEPLTSLASPVRLTVLGLAVAPVAVEAASGTAGSETSESAVSSQATNLIHGMVVAFCVFASRLGWNRKCA